MIEAFCFGCGYLFNPKIGHQAYCSLACRTDCRYHCKRALNPRRYAKAHVLTDDCIALRAHLKRCRRPNTIGYCLLDPETNLRYPFKGRTRRFRGNHSDLPYFELDPFIEVPLVGRVGVYQLFWYMKDGSLVPEKVNTDIEIKYAQRTDYRAVRRAQLQTQMPVSMYTKTQESIARSRVAETGHGVFLPMPGPQPKQIAGPAVSMAPQSPEPEPEPEPRGVFAAEPGTLLKSLDAEQVSQLPPQEKQRLADGVRQMLSESGIDMNQLLTAAGIATDGSSGQEAPPSGPPKRRKPKRKG